MPAPSPSSGGPRKARDRSSPPARWGRAPELLPYSPPPPAGGGAHPPAADLEGHLLRTSELYLLAGDRVRAGVVVEFARARAGEKGLRGSRWAAVARAAAAPRAAAARRGGAPPSRGAFPPPSGRPGPPGAPQRCGAGGTGRPREGPAMTP